MVIENLPPEVDLDQRTTAEMFNRDRAGLFSQSDYDIGGTSLVQHVIDTGMHRPFKQPLRRHPQAHLEIIDKHVTEMLQSDVIEPAVSPWSSEVRFILREQQPIMIVVSSYARRACGAYLLAV